MKKKRNILPEMGEFLLFIQAKEHSEWQTCGPFLLIFCCLSFRETICECATMYGCICVWERSADN